MAKRRRKQKGINPKAYTLDKRRKKAVKTQGIRSTMQTPIVKLYLDYLSTPENLMAGQKKNLNIFMAENEIGSYHTLEKYARAIGFQEELLRRKNNYIADEKLDMIELGKAGFKFLAKKHVLKREVIDARGEKRVIEEEQDPNVKACERLIQLGGGDIVDNINVTGTDAISAAATRITDTEDLK
jgi:hypothetical protein